MPSKGLSASTLQNILRILVILAVIAAAAPSVLDRPDLDYLRNVGFACMSIFVAAIFALQALVDGRMNGEMLLTVLTLFLIMGGCLAIVVYDEFIGF